MKTYTYALIEIFIYSAYENEFNRLRKRGSGLPSMSMKTSNRFNSVAFKMQAENITRVDTGICSSEVQAQSSILNHLCVC